MSCSCCGETRYIFLTLDHIDMATFPVEAPRGGVELYAWLIRNNFPGGIRTLCFNCNCGRELNGGICPHELERQEVVRLSEMVLSA